MQRFFLAVLTTATLAIVAAPADAIVDFDKLREENLDKVNFDKLREENRNKVNFDKLREENRNKVNFDKLREENLDKVNFDKLREETATKSTLIHCGMQIAKKARSIPARFSRIVNLQSA
jgi:hypothetical protein